MAGAERDFREGLRVDPSFTPLAVNLADLLRATQRDAEGRALLESEATRTDSTWRAPLSYSLGLARWRAGDRPGALEALRLAAKDDSTVHLRAWCLAERELRGKRAGWSALEDAMHSRPDTAALLTLAAQWAREDGQSARATSFTARLEELSR